jgi:hypothetical protein
MNRFVDARIPLVFGGVEDATADDALLLEGDGAAAPGRDWFTSAPSGGHPVGCVCCAPRNAAGLALGRLLLTRGRGTGPFFRRVVVVTRTDAGRQAVSDALAGDPLASVCFRQAVLF